jgi:hypothetical protein
MVSRKAAIKTTPPPKAPSTNRQLQCNYEALSLGTRADLRTAGTASDGTAT